MALFRYDADPAGVKADSTFVLIPTVLDDHDSLLIGLERAANYLADILAKGEPLRRVYAVRGTALEPITKTDQLVCP
jgi:hypothetical protein